MSKRKQTKGITLVALIITIIVLLILVMVSVSLVAKGGIKSKAKMSVKKYTTEEIGEQIKLAYSEYEMAESSDDTIDAKAFIIESLQKTHGDKLDKNSVKVSNEKIMATINGKTYRYNITEGESSEYVDPFDYKGKKKSELVPGDKITLTKGTVTESFTVVSNTNGKIVAMPKYNITLTTEHPVQSSSAASISFSSTRYWSQETGWNDSSKVKDGSVDIDMTEKNADKTYKNNIQQYIEAYQKTLEDMGADGILVRACRKPELDSELGEGLENPLTDEQKQNIRNPGKSNNFWLASALSGDSYHTWNVINNGNFSNSFVYGAGVRPVIEI